MRPHCKKYYFLLIFLFLGVSVAAQERAGREMFGNALNVGAGVGYYGYVGHPIATLHVNYEFGVVRNFTLAPFVTVYSYRKYAKKEKYYYSQTVVPMGVKGTYYFDELLRAGSKWDFYLAASLGLVLRRTVWEDGYFGVRTLDRRSGGVFVDAHIGAEYHIRNNVGLFLDLSTGISTFGLSFHF